MSSDRSTTQTPGTGAGPFSAADIKRRMAEREAAKAAEELRRMREQEEPGWEATLEGRPKAAYEFWHDHLRPLGFHLKAEVLEYPGGMPGDIGFFLTWK